METSFIIESDPASRGVPIPWTSLLRACGSQIALRLDVPRSALWVYFQPFPRPCFNPACLSEILAVQRLIIGARGVISLEGGTLELEAVVAASNVQGVFNLGGDLSLFSELIAQRDDTGLMRYAVDCVDMALNHANGYDCNLATVSLVEGRALGGGLECALASEYVVAEEQAKMGFPEINFNLFPGMGAYSLSARRIDWRAAEGVIAAGEVFSATKAREIGLVEALCATGAGVAAVNSFVEEHGRRRRLLRTVRNMIDPVSRREMLRSIEIWVDAAMRLDEGDLRLMRRLVQRQGNLASIAGGAPPRH